MCMLIEKTKCLKKGMYVYVVRYIHYKQILSPFHTNFIWKMKKTYTVEEGNIKIKQRLRKKTLDKSVFHCFYTQESANRFIDEMHKNNEYGKFQIHKAWIPAGTYTAEGEIVSGYIGYGRQCLGTRRLMLSKVVAERIVKQRTYAQYSTSAATGYFTGTSYFTSTGYACGTGSTT